MARPAIPSYFSQVEQELGLPAGYLTGSYGIESNYGANAGTSSAGAYGPFQFIPATAATYGLKDRGNLEASARAAAAYAADNAKLLTQALGRPPTAGELYLAHQQGSEGALALLLNPDVPAYKAVGSLARIRQNLPKSLQGRAKTMTAREFFNHWDGEFQNRVKMAAPASEYDPLTGAMRPQQVAAAQYDRAFFGATPYTDAVVSPRNEAMAQIQQLVHPAAAAPPAASDTPQISPFTRGQIVDPYGRVPEYGGKGELQRPMFRQWNADPIGNSKALEGGVSPALQQVVERARQIAGPTFQFTVGSGKRTPQQQALAAQFGWSRVSKGGTHEDGRAVDVWPVVNGQIVFDTDRMNAIGAAMTQASDELGIPMTWGKNFSSGPDIPHFEIGKGIEPKDPFGVVAAKAAGALPSLAPPGSASVPLPRPRPTPEPVNLAATGLAGQPAGVNANGTISLTGPVTLPRRPTNGMTMAGMPPGLIEPGNIDLTSRPMVKLPDGTTATVRSMSFGQDGREILVPTISPSGDPLTDDGAIDLYNQTGKNLGIFASPEAADNYAQTLHKQQEQYYGLSKKQEASPVYQQPATSGIPFSAPQFVAGGASIAPTRIATPPAPKSPAGPPGSIAGVTFGKGYDVPATPSSVQYAVQSLGDMGGAAPAMLAAANPPANVAAAAPVRKVQITPPMVSYTPPTTPPAPYHVAGPRRGMFGALGNVISKVFNPNTVGSAIAYPSVSYAQNPAAQAYLAGFGGGSAFTPAGFTAPNFSPGSGGSTFAYHSNGNGTGSYINSQGRTITYNANG